MLKTCVLSTVTFILISDFVFAQEEYFPLRLGNQWTYHSYMEDNAANTIIDSIFTISVINSTDDHYLFDRYFFYFSTLPFADSSSFKTEGGKIMRRYKERDILWYDFSADVGYSWIIPVRDEKFAPPDTTDIIATLRSKTDIFILGQDTLKNCIRFSFRLTKFIADENHWEELFAPNIGFVEGTFFTLGWHSTKLLGGIINDIPVSVRSPINTELKPNDFMLEQNYPNPFNVSTRINYTIRTQAVVNKVSLKIYNLLGQEIRTLVEKTHLPGIFQIIWDGKDNSGRSVTSGIYLYVLRVSNKQKANKLILVR